MHHVTKYCNVIEPVWQDTACICSSPDPFPLLWKWAGLARLVLTITKESLYAYIEAFQVFHQTIHIHPY